MPRLIISDPAGSPGLAQASADSFGALEAQAQAQTGRVVGALGAALNEYSETKSRVAAVRFEQELSSVSGSILSDPDIAGREERFESERRKLVEKHRPKFGSRSEYDMRTGLAAGDLKSRVNFQTAKDAIEESRLNTRLEVTHLVMKAAQADTVEDSLILMQEATEAIGSRSLAFTPAEIEVERQNAIGMGLRAMADTNPKRALQLIDNMGSVLAPEVLAVYRGHAMANIRQAASAEAAERREARRLEVEQRKESSLAAEDRLAELDLAGQLTLDAVRSEPDLSPAAKRRWKATVTGGGSGATDPDLYVELSEAAERGEDVRERLNEAAGNGLTIEQRNAILRTSRSVVFSGPRKHIASSLDPGAFSSDLQMRGKRSAALQSFDEWARENPTASVEESSAKANAIIKAAVARSGKPASLTRPGKTVEDVENAIEATSMQIEQGILVREEGAQKLRELRSIMDEMEQREALGELR